MRRIILNSTPLIYLAKIGHADLLRELSLEEFTSSLVHKEVVEKGKSSGAPEAPLIEALFKSGAINLKEPKKESIERFREVKGLSEADMRVLALAGEYDATAIIDDALARKTAKTFRIAYAGTPYLLITAFQQRLLSKQEMRRAIDDMISLGWRCGVEDYQRIIRQIDALNL